MTTFTQECMTLKGLSLSVIREAMPEDGTVKVLVDSPELLFRSEMNGYVAYTPRALYDGYMFCMDDVPVDWEDLTRNCNAMMGTDDLEVEGLVTFADYLMCSGALTERYNRICHEVDDVIRHQSGVVVFKDPVAIEHETCPPDWVSVAECRFIKDGWLGEDIDWYADIEADRLTFANKCLVADGFLNEEPIHLPFDHLPFTI